MFQFLIPIALGLTAASTVYSIQQQKKAAKAQKEASRKQQTMAEIESTRQRASAIREARVARAQAMNIGTQTGVAGSSGLLGGISAQGTQLANNIGYQNTQTAYGRAIGADINAANTASTNAAIAGQLANFSSKFMPNPEPKPEE